MAVSRGDFVWYELMTTDPVAAAAFYSAVLGWQCKDSGMPGMDYTLASVGEAGVGGIMALPDTAKAAGQPVGWHGYVAVDDVDVSAGHLELAGGIVCHAPTDIPGVGRFATVFDPQGAGIVLFTGTPGDTPPVVPPGTPGHVGWHELHTRQWPAAYDFWGNLVGWGQGDAIDMGAMGRYQLFTSAEGVPLGGMMNLQEAAQKPHWLYYFNVAGVAAGVARVQAAGGVLAHGPFQVPGGTWTAVCRDPQGGHFGLMSEAA